MGLRFEEDLRAGVTGQDRLPSWFSNLLPEGRLRQLVEQALAFSDSESRDMAGELKLVAALGNDLPGAVRLVLRDDLSPSEWDAPARVVQNVMELPPALRFSVAGVGLKFSMLRDGAQFVVPASDVLGDWIVKFPDRQFAALPQNEFGVMSLAREVGIDVPEIRLVDRDQVEALGDAVWGGERFAYAIKRFDRAAGGRIHTEDLAQVRGYYPGDKYRGAYETVGNLFFRGRDENSLVEFTRRLVFNVLVGNSDAHLKNWSLIYPDGRIPTIAPAYDIVSAAPYPRGLLTRDLALTFDGSRDSHGVNLNSIGRLERKLGLRDGILQDVARETAIRSLAAFADIPSELDSLPEMKKAIGTHIQQSISQFT